MLFDFPGIDDGGNNRIEMLRSDYFKAFIGALGLFLVIILYAIEIRHFDNTLNVQTMVGLSLMLGAVVGLSLGFYLKSYAEESLEIFQIFAVITLLSIVVMPLLVSLTNRLLSFSDVEYLNAEFVDTNAFVSSRFGQLPDQEVDGYHTFMIIQNQLERMTTEEHPFPEAKEGTLVKVPAKKGLWGFCFFVVKEYQRGGQIKEYQS